MNYLKSIYSLKLKPEDFIRFNAPYKPWDFYGFSKKYEILNTKRNL
ncbi:MAG: hypothetical protein KAQ79_21175 [Cyclobacteriaceae bacterium]|nr:hypothetical protein [Cyclobacteriaceae bacterium]